VSSIAQAAIVMFVFLGSLGPLPAGVAIEVAGNACRRTWFVRATAILISIPFLGPLRDADLREA
jgi:hypothetical protein